MRQRYRIPLLFASILAISAGLLLWFRVPPTTPGAALPTAVTVTAPAASVTPAPTRAPAPPTPALASTATPADGAFGVRVVTSAGPVPGARVRAWLRVARDDAEPNPWRLANEGTTGANGTLRLPASPGDYLLSAHLAGHAPARREATRPVGEAETPVELSLATGVSLQGRTVAEGTQEPIPLAELVLRPYPGAAIAWAEPTSLPEESATTTSDTRGHFQFAHLAPGRYALTAEAPGFSPRVLRFLQVPTTAELVVGLWGAGTLEGFVVDAKGQPVAGAELLASGGPAPVRATTSEGGGFAFEVHAGSWVLTARRGDMVGRLPGTLSVAPGQTLRGLTVTLGAASGLAGRVTASDGTPIRDALLVASPSRADGELGRATSGGEGIYRLELPPGDYDLAIQAPGYARARLDAVVVPSGAFASLDVKLEPATAEVEGTVTNTSGQPVAHAEVRAEQREGLARSTRSDAQGAYRLTDLAPGPTFVRARRDGVQGWTSRTDTLKAGTRARVDLTLTESGMVQGRVTLASGERVPEPAVVRAVPRGTPAGSADMAWTETDAEGLYHLELPAGVYQLTAVLPRARFMYFHEDDPAVTVQEGSALQQDLLLTEERGISGTVLEASGAPSPFAAVAAVQGGDFPLTVRVRADEDGAFALPTRPPGAPPLAELVAHNAGRVARLAHVSEGQGPVRLRLQPAAHLRGRVVARSGTPPDGFTLTLNETNGEELPWASVATTTRQFSGSTFELHDAPGQGLQLSVRTRDGRSGEAQVTLTPGGNADVEVPLTQGASSISGRAVWSRNGGPASGVAVFLDRTVTASPDTVTGTDGRFHLDAVRPGAHTVRLAPPEGRVETRAVKVAEVESTDLGDISVAPRRATPGTLGAGFSENRGHVAFAWLTPEGPAARAGITVGDRLVAVDGVVVRNRTEAELRSRGAPGSPVRLRLVRGGNEQELQATRAD
ncbi:carboxypeptidase regulatory-like domain-containing protein [Myxococcus sp. K15C18031901]|uniref:carboxypeptidase regulatory-like domain-containing protein n=1 Tax=Myxococcus dinghuensis TaxID=2906761 RepID=UPI002B20A929|nr:carboxypeptidase regulatory-like domain-containing protein [Myxococcus dinghuensis]MCP3099861.1 carboxypeptidase regulatory-like domain-containing protein [Myxococcus dinghuensis]